MVARLLTSQWTWLTMYLVGFAFLGGYLALNGDWSISLTWAFGYVAISSAVAVLFGGLRLHELLPMLDRHLLFPRDKLTDAVELTSDEWALGYAKYIDAGLRSKAALLTPAEDGFICVPVLLIGVSSLSAIGGGIVFGLLHLGRFTYLDCIAKAITYSLVCLLVLPHGLLTVVLGHFMMNSIGFLGIQLSKRKLSAQLRSNPTVKTDARRSSARGSL